MSDSDESSDDELLKAVKAKAAKAAPPAKKAKVDVDKVLLNTKGSVDLTEVRSRTHQCRVPTTDRAPALPHSSCKASSSARSGKRRPSAS